MDTGSVMTCGQSRSNTCITQPLKRRSDTLSTLAGRIRNVWNVKPPKQVYGTISAMCAVGFVRNHFERIGLILDGGEVSQKVTKMATTFAFSSMADWAADNLLALAMVAVVLWTMRPSPKRFLVTAINKWRQWR